jgi:hypothetical protein
MADIWMKEAVADRVVIFGDIVLPLKKRLSASLLQRSDEVRVFNPRGKERKMATIYRDEYEGL